MFQNKNYHVKQLCLAGLILSIVIICKIINFLIGPIILGYELQLHYIPYIIGLIFLKNMRQKFSFFLIVPWILIIFNVNGHPIFDYIFTMYSFFGFMFFKKTKNNIKLFLELLILLFFSFILINWWNVLSGVLYYKFSFLASLLFNSFFNIINFVICFLFLFLFYKFFILEINKNYEYFNQSWSE